MKKLMIAAAIVCAAVVSQAASYQWMAMGITGYEVTTPYSGAATLYAYGTDGLVDSFSGSMVNGMINQVVSSDKFVDGQSYSFTYSMTDTAGNVFTASYPAVQAQSKSTPSLMFMNSGSWTAAPEPTSGMLLLIGVGALALRRRRA